MNGFHIVLSSLRSIDKRKALCALVIGMMVASFLLVFSSYGDILTNRNYQQTSYTDMTGWKTMQSITNGNETVGKISMNGDYNSSYPPGVFTNLHRYCTKDFIARKLPANELIYRVLQWLCRRLNENPPLTSPLISGDASQFTSIQCRKYVMYRPIGRLGNLMSLYAVIFSFEKNYGVTGYVERSMWSRLKEIFPHITLKNPQQSSPVWKDISFRQAERVLSCKNSTDARESGDEFFRIIDYPQRNGIDVFHPHYQQLKKEFKFSDQLEKLANAFLYQAKGNRKEVTYIGFHIRGTDYRQYIKQKYNVMVPEQSYFLKCLDYYRKRYKNPLFIVTSDEMAYVKSTFESLNHEDVVLAGNGALDSPARDMAILAACNHSVVTVGTYGFWAAYLAGGTVLVPELQSHIGRGDRGTPLLEIQLAGADNWVSIS